MFPDADLFRVIWATGVCQFFGIYIGGRFSSTHMISKNYMCRIGILALLSEIPFDLTVSGKILEFGHQNILFYFVYRSCNDVIF